MILILGASGFVGSAIAHAFSLRGIAYSAISRSSCDYTDAGTLNEVIRATRPRFLVNAAGYTGRPNVDGCESNQSVCLAANADLPRMIRNVCEANSLPWGHVSSGCIYQGLREDGLAFREEDPPNFCFDAPPCSFYSGSKWEGEKHLHGASNVYVWRIRMPFSHRDHTKNYLSKLMRYERLLDATNSLTELDEFASACIHCIENQVPHGTYHVVNSEPITTRQVVALIRRHRCIDRPFEFFRDESEFMRLAATAPRSNCVLDNTKLTTTGFQMNPACEAVEQALRSWTSA